MLTKQATKALIKRAGIMDMLGGAMDSITGMVPEGLGALTGAGSAAGLANLAGGSGKAGLISAAIGAAIGAMTASKMKDHEQAQQMGIDSNSMLGINNAIMNLNQQAMLDPYGMGMGMDMGMGMGALGVNPGVGMDTIGGSAFPPSNPVTGYPEAQQAMQQPKQASVHANTDLEKIASDLVDSYFG